MANPRELAQQAFTLLQNALRASEARAEDLDAQLKRKKAPKNRLEEQLDVLTHRLEMVEAERARWQQEAGHLEEIAEAERAKVAQLKKRLQIAESGPEKLTKKEINFWKAKAEDIDTETKDYKARLATLRREIMERDALIEKLNRGQSVQLPAAPASEEPAEATGWPPITEDTTVAELNEQLARREEELESLQAQLAELKVQQAVSAPMPGVAFDAQVEIDGLRQQNARYEQALNEAHAARVSLKTELSRVQATLTQVEQANTESQANNAHIRTTLGEREQRIAALSAELAEIRAEHSANQGEFGSLRTSLTDAQADLSRAQSDLSQAQQELDAVRQELVQARERNTELEKTGQQTSSDRERMQATLDEREQRVVELSSTIEQLRANLEQTEENERRVKEEFSAAAAREEELRATITEREQQAAALQAELDTLRAEREQETEQAGSAQAELAQLRAELDESRSRAEEQVAELESLRTSAAESLERAQRADASLQDAQVALAEREEDLARRDWQSSSLSAELEQARATIEANDRELASMRDTLLEANRELDQLRQHRQRLETEVSEAMTRADEAVTAAGLKDQQIAELTERNASLESERTGINEQIAGLEAELKEEKDNAENLGALANERHELMTKLREQLEEAQERHEEAKWRLGKAQHFERLVNRRKGLIAALIAALRMKMKANTALKAGLDSLRTHKAAGEVQQQKLLQRIDALKAKLQETEERLQEAEAAIERHQGATHAKDQLADSESRASSLEERLNTQAELIQSLEADLKLARASQKTGDEKTQEIERLQKELETKNEVITKLQADTDEQQRKLAKLRGSESETLRLKAMNEQDRSAIDALEREVAQLRDALSRQKPQDGDDGRADLEAKLKERDNSVTRLMGTIKEHEVTIRKLSESADSWKRKYEFLSTEAPDAYKTAAEK